MVRPHLGHRPRSPLPHLLRIGPRSRNLGTVRWVVRPIALGRGLPCGGTVDASTGAGVKRVDALTSSNVSAIIRIPQGNIAAPHSHRVTQRLASVTFVSAHNLTAAVTGGLHMDGEDQRQPRRRRQRAAIAPHNKEFMCLPYTPVADC